MHKAALAPIMAGISLSFSLSELSVVMLTLTSFK